MSINDGGPAFPASYPCGPSGMTLRDYFAAKALQPMLGATAKPGMSTERAARIVAQAAYEMADAMLAAREAK